MPPTAEHESVTGVAECPFKECVVDGVHRHGTDVAYSPHLDRPGSFEQRLREAFDAGVKAQAVVEHQRLTGDSVREVLAQKYAEWRQSL